MEKRLLLAIVLSLMVLFIWNSLFPSPTQPPKINTLVEKTFEDKQQEISAPIIIEEKETIGLLPEKVTYLENDKLNLTFSSQGGTIKNIFLKEYKYDLPLQNIANPFGSDNKSFRLIKSDMNSVFYQFEGEDILINKKYELNNYSLDITVEIENKVNDRLDNISMKLYTIKMSNLSEKAKIDPTFNRDRGLYEYVIKLKNNIIRKNNAFKFHSKEKEIIAEPLVWAGFRDRYYCAIIKPEFSTEKVSILPIDETRLDVDIDPAKVKEVENAVQYQFEAYFGPENVDKLAKIDSTFPDIKRYYRNGLFDGIAKIIAFILSLIHKFIPNWGVSIIILSLLVYFSMYPLTLRSMSSMRKMQQIQPKIAALKEKYKNNPQKMNQELMDIYRKEKINPLGGCLPMLLQMPVFFGLYQVLWRSVSLKGANFLWIKDLSEPDRLFMLSKTLPIIGNEINLLPILMIGIMVLQQKVTAKNMVVTDPDQIMQQKMMATIFPIMFGWIFYHFASGLTIYFIMFYTLSTFTQWKMSKQS
jgi:YidC/Oxa1 family membrane protein insertase